MNPNETITNIKTGERLTLLVSGKQTGGASNVYQLYLPPHYSGPPMHYHTGFLEIFSVEKGKLDFYTGDNTEPVTLTDGENIVVQIGQPHRFANNSDKPVTIVVEARPAGSLVRAFQLAYGVANNGGARADGLPESTLVRLYFTRLSHAYSTTMPLFIQKILFAFATFILTITGQKQKLDRYVVY